jgi:iron-sulfur cluster assembly protein
MEILKKNNLLTLTPNAIARLRDINTNSSSDHTAVKLGVKNGGCAGMAYTMDYINEIKENDEVVIIDDLTLVIDPKAILFLLGTEMDYEESTLNSGFIFNNPTLVEADIPVDLADRLIIPQ